MVLQVGGHAPHAHGLALQVVVGALAPLFDDKGVAKDNLLCQKNIIIIFRME